ncbi:uncharacterized protein G2W53_035413 [Senna tora]|uniref:Uncharacterized protein n=1 Tax=Senna tora TaxID=362788 RepID=A0A834W3Z5_9FABA|nr:uncharacterized protein G2W53_035413 [Senna tora]
MDSDFTSLAALQGRDAAVARDGDRKCLSEGKVNLGFLWSRREEEMRRGRNADAGVSRFVLFFFFF